jgi:hypothetical protein
LQKYPHTLYMHMCVYTHAHIHIAESEVLLPTTDEMMLTHEDKEEKEV